MPTRRHTAVLNRSRKRKPGEPYTILAFCEAHHFSEATYFALKRSGRGPREMKFGRRTLITEEAANDWQREREAETAAGKAPRSVKGAARESEAQITS